MIEHIKSDYPERAHLMESKDCTVRALAASTGMPYLEAHKLCAEFGRPFRKGFRPNRMLMALNSRGFEVKELQTLQPTFYRRENIYTGYARTSARGYETLVACLRRLPQEGAFYICTTSHALAFVNGKVVDSNHRIQKRARVESVHSITKRQVENVAMTQEQVNELWARLDRYEGKV